MFYKKYKSPVIEKQNVCLQKLLTTLRDMNKNLRNILIIMAAVCLVSCNDSTDKIMAKGKQDVIGKQSPNIQNRQFSAEALWGMGRIGNISVEESTGNIAYQVTYYSVEKNKSNTELFLLKNKEIDNVNRGKTDTIRYDDALELTKSNYHESDCEWLDKEQLLYLSNESGSSQIWVMDIKNKSRRQLSNFENDIEGFKISPNKSKIIFISQVKTIPQAKDKYADLPLTSGRIIDDLMYKHWDEWTESAPHPYIADIEGNSITNVKDILEGEPYECPMKPFGGVEQICWSPDNKYIVYTCRKKVGLEYAISTNSDLYLYDIESGKTTNLTEGMMGYDTNPQFSPDGKHLAWLSMERDGYESDQNRLFVMDIETLEKQFISYQFDSNVDEFIWYDNNSLIFSGVWHALCHLYKIDLSGNIKELTDGQYDYSIVGKYKNYIYTLRHSMREANELFMFNLNNIDTRYEAKTDEYLIESKLEKEGILKQITFENKHIYDNVDLGNVEPRWQKTTDGKRMLTWIIYPPHFDPQKKYPTLLYCEGGPQSPVSQFWSYRWNFMRMAAHGYIIVAPNRRGLPGFGKEWNEEISGDYGGQCMKDYLSAIDEFSQEPFVDKEHLGCVGASFGGYSVYWLAGHHNGRFKAFIAHDGIFNMEMQYLETEEKWFANWDMGGPYWDKNNKIAQRTFANSPHLFVDKWDTPILCIHGEKDYRILANQAMAAFDAAKLRGVPAELLIFPDENHWVLKPQNGILWQREFIGWLDRWLKSDDNKEKE